MAAKGTGRIVSQAELAQIFGVSAATIRSWESRGCPVVERGGKGKAARYNTAQISRWREDQIALAASGDSSAVDFDEAKRRRMMAAATIAEVEADLKSGSVVEIDDVVTAVVGEFTLVRNKLISIGAKLAPRLAAIRSPEEAKAAIDAEVALALAELTQDHVWQQKQGARGPSHTQ